MSRFISAYAWLATNAHQVPVSFIKKMMRKQAAATIYTDLLWSEIIPNDVLETLPNPFLGDGVKVALGEDRVNDLRVFIALFR